MAAGPGANPRTSAPTDCSYERVFSVGEVGFVKRSGQVRQTLSLRDLTNKQDTEGRLFSKPGPRFKEFEVHTQVRHRQLLIGYARLQKRAFMKRRKYKNGVGGGHLGFELSPQFSTKPMELKRWRICRLASGLISEDGFRKAVVRDWILQIRRYGQEPAPAQGTDCGGVSRDEARIVTPNSARDLPIQPRIA